MQKHLTYFTSAPQVYLTTCVSMCVCVLICYILSTKILKQTFLQSGTILACPHKVRIRVRASVGSRGI